MSIRYIPQQNNGFWDMLGQGLLSGYQKGQQYKQDKIDTQGLLDMQTYQPDVSTAPTETSIQDLTPQNNIANQQITQGLLPTRFSQQPVTSSMIGQGLFGKPQAQQQQQFFAMPQPQTTEQGQAQTAFDQASKDNPEWYRKGATPNSSVYVGDRPDLATDAIVDESGNITKPTTTATPNLMGRYSKENNPANVTTKERGIKDIERDYHTQWANKMKETFANMSPDAIRQYLPQIMAARKEGLTQLQTDYTKEQETKAWNDFDSAPDYRSKLMTGIKAGLNPNLLKMALDTGVDIKMLDLNDKMVAVGIDSHNNKVIDLATGQQIDPSILTKGISAAQQATIDMSKYTHDNPSGNAILSAQLQRERPARVYGGSGDRQPAQPKPPTVKQTEEYSNNYQGMLSDIWDSKTNEERMAKIQQYGPTLNAIGQALDIDVQNDIDYIAKTNPSGRE